MGRRDVYSTLSVGVVIPWVAGCSMLVSIQESLAERRCDSDRHRAAMVTMVRSSPLITSHLDRPVVSENSAMRRALRANGLAIEWGEHSTEVKLSCTRLRLNDDKRSDTILTMEVQGEWRLSSVVHGGKDVEAQFSMSATNLAGGDRLPFNSVFAVAEHGNRNRSTPVADVYQPPPPATPFVPPQPVAPNGRAQPSEPTPKRESVPDAIEDRDEGGKGSVVQEKPAPAPRDTPPESVPGVHRIVVERGGGVGDAPVDPLCATLRPPSLREAVQVALLCAQSAWRLVPPSHSEPKDYSLPHTITLSGGPNEWVIVLSRSYGLRFEQK